MFVTCLLDLRPTHILLFSQVHDPIDLCLCPGVLHLVRAASLGGSRSGLSFSIGGSDLDVNREVLITEGRAIAEAGIFAVVDGIAVIGHMSGETDGCHLIIGDRSGVIDERVGCLNGHDGRRWGSCIFAVSLGSGMRGYDTLLKQVDEMN